MSREAGCGQSWPQAEGRSLLWNFLQSLLKPLGDSLDTLSLTDKEISSELRKLAPGHKLNQAEGAWDWKLSREPQSRVAELPFQASAMVSHWGTLGSPVRPSC
jgi:hypothetical protein